MTKPVTVATAGRDTKPESRPRKAARHRRHRAGDPRRGDLEDRRAGRGRAAAGRHHGAQGQFDVPLSHRHLPAPQRRAQPAGVAVPAVKQSSPGLQPVVARGAIRACSFRTARLCALKRGTTFRPIPHSRNQPLVFIVRADPKPQPCAAVASRERAEVVGDAGGP